MSLPSIDILVDEEGVGCLVSDQEPAKEMDCVTFHQESRLMAVVFKDGTEFQMEHKILPEIAARLQKMREITLIVLADGEPYLHSKVLFKLL